MNSKDESISYKTDIELFEYMLEKAEIEHEEFNTKIELENGIIVNFDENGELIGFELPEGR